MLVSSGPTLAAAAVPAHSSSIAKEKERQAWRIKITSFSLTMSSQINRPEKAKSKWEFKKALFSIPLQFHTGAYCSSF